MLTVMELLDVKPLASHQLELSFSDGTQGVFNGADYLATRSGTLLDARKLGSAEIGVREIGGNWWGKLGSEQNFD